MFLQATLAQLKWYIQQIYDTPCFVMKVFNSIWWVYVGVCSWVNSCFKFVFQRYFIYRQGQQGGSRKSWNVFCKNFTEEIKKVRDKKRAYFNTRLRRILIHIFCMFYLFKAWSPCATEAQSRNYGVNTKTTASKKSVRFSPSYLYACKRLMWTFLVRNLPHYT